VLAQCSIASTASRKFLSLLYCPTMYTKVQQGTKTRTRCTYEVTMRCVRVSATCTIQLATTWPHILLLVTLRTYHRPIRNFISVIQAWYDCLCFCIIYSYTFTLIFIPLTSPFFLIEIFSISKHTSYAICRRSHTSPMYLRDKYSILNLMFVFLHCAAFTLNG
jgi:hypothetical protein